MKHFGRYDMKEGGHYPTGLRWGHVKNSLGERLESYVIIRRGDNLLFLAYGIVLRLRVYVLDKRWRLSKRSLMTAWESK